MRLIWIVLPCSIYTLLSIFPLVYTQIHQDKALVCMEIFECLVAITFQLNILPPVIFLLLRLLKYQEASQCPQILVILTSGLTLYLVLCLLLRVQVETTFNSQFVGYCSPTVLVVFCKIAAIACSTILGTIWLIFTGLFLQYAIRSSKKKLGIVVAASLWVGVLSIYSIYEVYQAKLPRGCPKTLLIWTFRTTIHITAFLIVFFSCTSYNIFDNQGANVRVFGSFFFKLFLPFNIFAYLQGLEWCSEAQNSNAECVGAPNVEFLELVVYEWLILSVFWTMVLCWFFLKFRVLTKEQLRLNPFLMMIGLSMQEIEEGWENHEQAENQVALLDSTVFDASRHSRSFQEKTVCPICWENFKAEKIVTYFPGCEHIYHSKCIQEWVRGHNTCPTCRRSLTLSVEMLEISPHQR